MMDYQKIVLKVVYPFSVLYQGFQLHFSQQAPYGAILYPDLSIEILVPSASSDTGGDDIVPILFPCDSTFLIRHFLIGFTQDHKASTSFASVMYWDALKDLGPAFYHSLSVR